MNAITLITKALQMLDLVYKQSSLTAIFEVPAELRKETLNAKTFLIAKRTLPKLGDYSRATGAATGDVTLDWETFTLEQDRGVRYTVDEMDATETGGLAIAGNIAQLVKESVVPETDTYTFAKLAGNAGKTVSQTLTKENVIEALEEANAVLTDAEVPEEGRVLFVNTTTYKNLKLSAEYSTQVITTDGNVQKTIEKIGDIPLIKVPSARFYTQCTPTAAGLTIPEGAKAINFMLVHPSAVMKITKLNDARVFTPEQNQATRGYLIDYRLYFDVFVLENKKAAIYVNHAV